MPRSAQAARLSGRRPGGMGFDDRFGGACSPIRFAPLAAPGCHRSSIIASDLHRRDDSSQTACLQCKRSRSVVRGAVAPALTCSFVLSPDAAEDDTGAQKKKTPTRRLFESIALSWEVELRGFEPRTSCMPYESSR